MDYIDALDRIIRRTVTLTKADNVQKTNNYFDFEAWEWPQGVGMYGMYRAWKNSGNREYLDYITSWYERRFAEEAPIRNVNTVAPMYTLTYLYEDGIMKNDKILDCIKEWADWVVNGLPRTKSGAFEHYVGTNYDASEQLWDDTLYMTVLFFARAGRILHKPEYVEEAKLQFLQHIHYLCDPRTGLFYHGWHSVERHNFGRVFWGRGNSWLTAGIVDFIELLDDGAVRSYLVNVFNDQVDMLINLQDDSGMWRTVLDMKDAYIETSATSAIAYGILKGIRLGILSADKKEAARKAADALMTQIDSNGAVQNVSAGTTVGLSPEAYLKIPIQERIYGQSMMLLVLSELC